MSQLVNVKGLADLQKALSALPAKIENNIMAGALRAGAKVIADEAKRLVPVSRPSSDNQKKYGTAMGELRRSIRVSVKRDKNRGRIVAAVKVGNKKAWYGYFVEYGTSAHHITAKDRPQRQTRHGLKTMSVRTMNRNLRRGTLAIGGQVIGSGVFHPGAIAKPFLRPAFDGQNRAALQAAGDYIAKRLASKRIAAQHGMQVGGAEVWS